MRSIANALAPLASEVVQERYIANATRSEYLVPEELLERAHAIVKLVQSGHQSTRSLGAEARAQILALAPLLSAELKAQLVERSLSSESLLHDPAWVAIRHQAAACLRALSFDLKAWEDAQ